MLDVTSENCTHRRPTNASLPVPKLGFFCKCRVLEGPVCTDRVRSAFGVYSLAYGLRVPEALYFWQLLKLGDKGEYLSIHTIE